MRISDWSSDVCSSDLRSGREVRPAAAVILRVRFARCAGRVRPGKARRRRRRTTTAIASRLNTTTGRRRRTTQGRRRAAREHAAGVGEQAGERSEEHTYEIKSLMSKQKADLCWIKKN